MNKAEQHFKRACVLWQDMSDNHGLIRGFTNLGLLYIKMEHPLEALTYLENALHQAKLSGEETEIGKTWINLGMAHRQYGNLEKAENYIKQAEGIFYQFSNMFSLAQVWNELGLIYLQQRKWEKAIRYLKDSLEAYCNLDNREGEMEALLDIVEYELTRGDQVQATLRLNEVEQLIRQYTQGSQKDSLTKRLEKYRLAASLLKT